MKLGTKSRRTIRLSIPIIAFAVIGVVLLTFSSAAVYNYIIEPEEGTASGAQLVTDTSATGGKAIQFGRSTTPTVSVSSSASPSVITTPSKSPTGNQYHIEGCPVRNTNYLIFARKDWFIGDRAKVTQAVQRYKDACMIPLVGALTKDQFILALDISKELGTHMFINYNRHQCYANSTFSAPDLNNDMSVTDNTQTEQELRTTGEFSPGIIDHSALIGYYVFDEDDKLYGWPNSIANRHFLHLMNGKKYECTGGLKFMPTIEAFNRFVDGTGKMLIGVTYPCLVNPSGQCDKGQATPQVHVMPYEKDNFMQPFKGKLDAVGYFSYPYWTYNLAGTVSSYGNPVIVHQEAVLEAVRLAKGWNAESFFITEAWRGYDAAWFPEGEGIWPTEAQYRELRKQADNAGIQWLGYWSEWATPPEIFEQHWPDIKNAVRKD